MYLNDNHLTGRIPASLGNLIELQELYLSINHLTGSIPASMGNLKKLEDFYLSINHLSGSIPASLGNLSQLQVFNVSYNNLGGSMPSSLSYLRFLTEIFANDNKLSGSLERVFNSANQVNLATVLLNNNEFTGTLPPSLFALPSLSTVVLVSNCFSGSLPSAMCGSTSLVSIVLDGLSSGVSCRSPLLPAFFSSSYKVSHFMSGSIPSCLLTELPSLTTLHLSGNGFTGRLPNEVNNNLLDLSLSQFYSNCFPAACVV
jgi:Leucine-rich repeat (LRR) protein